MGNSYTSLSQQEPGDVLRESVTCGSNAPATSSLRTISDVRVAPPQKREALHSSAIGCLAAVRAGMLIAGTREGEITLNNMDTGECVQRWRAPSREVAKVCYRHCSSGNRHAILSGDREAAIHMWSFNSDKPLRSFISHRLTVTGLVSTDESHFASGSRDTAIKLWDVERPENPIREESINRNLVKMTHFTLEHAKSRLWDARTLRLVHQFEKHQQIQTTCEITSDGTYILSASNGFNGNGCDITVWDVRARRALRSMTGHEANVNGLALVALNSQSAPKSLLLSVSSDATVRLWNWQEGVHLWTEPVDLASPLLACSVFTDSSIAVGGENGTLVSLRLFSKAGRPLLVVSSFQSQNEPGRRLQNAQRGLFS